VTLRTRLQRLEADRPAIALTGWNRFIWNGPQDDAALNEAEAAADAANRGLIIVRIAEPPPARELKCFR
jgi:hypothetical protein